MKIALLPPDAVGHTNPLLALSRELLARGKSPLWTELAATHVLELPMSFPPKLYSAAYVDKVAENYAQDGAVLAKSVEQAQEAALAVYRYPSSFLLVGKSGHFFLGE